MNHDLGVHGRCEFGEASAKTAIEQRLADGEEEGTSKGLGEDDQCLGNWNLSGGKIGLDSDDGL